MTDRWVLTEYFQRAIELAECTEIEGGVTCRVPSFWWAGAFEKGATRDECLRRLRGRIEETTRQILKQGRDLPPLTPEEAVERDKEGIRRYLDDYFDGGLSDEQVERAIGILFE